MASWSQITRPIGLEDFPEGRYVVTRLEGLCQSVAHKRRTQESGILTRLTQISLYFLSAAVPWLFRNGRQI